jgi:hypothetical protein
MSGGRDLRSYLLLRSRSERQDTRQIDVAPDRGIGRAIALSNGAFLAPARGPHAINP